MSKEQAHGSILGGVLLIAGCCIGAGMLGLPVLSTLAGFAPSILMLLLAWAYMCYTGLLLLEVTLRFPDGVNIVSMATKTLGLWGKVVAWGTFLFLFYSVIVAYIIGSGLLVSDMSQDYLSLTLPSWIGSTSFCLLLSLILFMGTKAADIFNRLLMGGLILSYLVLVILGLPYVDPKSLHHSNWSLTPFVLPVMIFSFGYHNLVPSITTYLKRDPLRIRWTIIAGSLIPLLVYLIWEWLILGLIPTSSASHLQSALDEGLLATQILRSASGVSWVIDLAQLFAFFSIVTSFVGVSLSFVDFLSDGLQIKKTPFGKIILCLLVLFPPWIFAFLYPQLFLSALGYAGGFGAVILFGLLPAAMVWKIRRTDPLKDQTRGGTPALVCIVLISFAVIIFQMILEWKGRMT